MTVDFANRRNSVMGSFGKSDFGKYTFSFLDSIDGCPGFGPLVTKASDCDTDDSRFKRQVKTESEMVGTLPPLAANVYPHWHCE